VDARLIAAATAEGVAASGEGDGDGRGHQPIVASSGRGPRYARAGTSKTSPRTCSATTSGGCPARAELDADTAWRLCTRGITPGQAAGHARIDGDQNLVAAALQIVSIIWSPPL